MAAAASPEAICLLEFIEPVSMKALLEQIQRRHRRSFEPGTTRLLERLERQLGEYFAGARRGFDLPLAQPGSEFQRRVWGGLGRIPYGQTTSYGALAEAIGRPGSARAVGGANGANQLPILVPCHRVIAAGGKLGGYGAGAWRKRRLLELEGIRLARA
jgi:AraC family transcriptional regulator of adaptative response/methylated-DNA-[protein]-cysteine methyltransferase